MLETVRAFMKPLEQYLKQKDITEIVVKESGYLHLKRVSAWERIQSQTLDQEYWEQLCHALAALKKITLADKKIFSLSSQLPGGHRIEAMLGENLSSRIAISIEINHKIKRSLADFGFDVALAKEIIELMNKGCNLFISGKTASGKTTLLETLLEQIYKNKRIVIIEDWMQELELPEEKLVDKAFINRSREDSQAEISETIEGCIRTRSELVVVGDISVENAYPVLRLLNTGHNGFFCTIHANSPKQAIDIVFPTNIEMAGHNAANARKFLNDIVDIVIHLNDDRKVSEIYYPKAGKSKRFADSKLSDKHLELVSK